MTDFPKGAYIMGVMDAQDARDPIARTDMTAQVMKTLEQSQNHPGRPDLIVIAVPAANGDHVARAIREALDP